MPIAAVPAYLGKDFKDASPGMRFGIYLPIWTERADQEAEVKKCAEAKSGEGKKVQALLKQGMDHAIQQLRQRNNRPLPGLWDQNDFAAKQAWSKVIKLSPRDRDMAQGLRNRQRMMTTVAGDTILSLEALSIAPFATGLGNEHPLENGFAFLNPYGLPYLPGSGVKGVLRQAARELASGDWGDEKGWKNAKTFPLMQGQGTNRKPVLDKHKQPILLSMLDTLFGLESESGDTQHVRGALTFWDVIPQIKGDSLMVEIMTPHQSHYYQQKGDRKAGDIIPPHDSGQPTPISFLTVPPGSGFAFHVQCDLAHLEHLAPDLAAAGRWKTLLTAAFEHAFQWLGFGAKTAVGYGAMQEDPEVKKRAMAQKQAEADAAERARKEEARQVELAQMSPIEREIQVFLDQRQDKNQPELSALLAGLKQGQWSGEHKISVAEQVKARMQTAKKWREKSEKKNPDKDHDYQDTLKVIAWIQGK